MSSKPTKKTTTSASSNGPKPAPPSKKNDTCAACTKPLTSPKVTTCNHTFCADCIFDKLKEPCPTCGAAIFPKQDPKEVAKNAAAATKKKATWGNALGEDDSDDGDDDGEVPDESEQGGHYADHKFNSSKIGYENRDYADEFSRDRWDDL